MLLIFLSLDEADDERWYPPLLLTARGLAVLSARALWTIKHIGKFFPLIYLWQTLTAIEPTRKQLSHCLKTIRILMVFPVSPRWKKALQAMLGRDEARVLLGRHAGSRRIQSPNWAGLGCWGQCLPRFHLLGWCRGQQGLSLWHVDLRVSVKVPNRNRVNIPLSLNQYIISPQLEVELGCEDVSYFLGYTRASLHLFPRP